METKPGAQPWLRIYCQPTLYALKVEDLISTLHVVHTDFMRVPCSLGPYAMEMRFQCQACKNFTATAASVDERGLGVLYHAPCAPPDRMPLALREEMLATVQVAMRQSGSVLSYNDRVLCAAHELWRSWDSLLTWNRQMEHIANVIQKHLPKESFHE